MADYLDFEKIDYLDDEILVYEKRVYDIGRCIKFPFEDVAPVIHAHWETDKHAALDFCSSCGEAVERYVTAEQMDRSNYKGETFWNYCPHCGAKMDEEDD